MNILFLTQYPRLSPSSRYRVYQLLPFLRSVGFRCDVVPMLSESEYRLSRKRGRLIRNSMMMARAFARRIQLLRSSGNYDLIYVLKGIYPYGPPLFERILSETGVPVIFDFDDAIHIHKASTHHRISDWLKFSSRLSESIQLADRVLVPNKFLAEFATQHNSRVSILPEAEDTQRLSPRTEHVNGGKIVIGWIGSESTAKYLSLITPALTEICRRYPRVVLRVIGGQYAAAGVRTEQVEWSLKKETERFHELDIGIMPLPFEEWSRGKSGCKMRQYMATGVPGVATNIGYNQELVQHNQTGLLVNTNADWVNALSTLIDSPELRNRIARAARLSVVERFSHDVIGPKLAAILSETGGVRDSSVGRAS